MRNLFLRPVFVVSDDASHRRPLGNTMSKLRIDCGHGVTEIVNVAPNTTLGEVLGEVCTRRKLEPSGHALRHTLGGKKDNLDGSLSFRLSGLSNNAKLELVAAANRLGWPLLASAQWGCSSRTARAVAQDGQGGLVQQPLGGDRSAFSRGGPSDSTVHGPHRRDRRARIHDALLDPGCHSWRLGPPSRLASHPVQPPLLPTRP